MGTGREVLLTARFWLAPILLVVLVMSSLAALYMGGLLDPTRNLNEFPVAVVNQDEGDVQVGSDPPQHVVIGDQIVDGLEAGVDPEKIAFEPMGIAQAQQGLDDASLYGSIVIPSDFTKRLMILAQASVVPGDDIERPVITVYTNPRAGTLGANIARQIGQQAMDTVNQRIGEQVSTQVTDQLAATAPDLQLSGASKIVLSEPVDVRFVEHAPLPDGTGYGLAAFYYALLLVLAGFTGATIINTLVDGLLGFTPTEIGPLYLHNESVPVSRLQTTVVKWVIVVLMSMVVSGIYVWVGHIFGLPIPQNFSLWLYGMLTISAVGITSISTMAVFGNIGLLVNLFVFIIIGLPSSGGTIPLDAAPKLYSVLADFAPMHQVYLGVRGLLFFNGAPGNGLLHGTWMTILGVAVGLVFGAAVTAYYDWRGLHRTHKSVQPGEPLPAEAATRTDQPDA
ncbi:DUF3533 domain-containing protein [Rhodococcus sp. HNM0569]|uniref:YhgE/Pip domain-containing protein n=1 Tax=Rhodococcus sp. HNM0569 TaxID=2716340 RepID=UPI00146E5272|nr:DUF3533 domain-containing protein [Rhodococcus sp. HNM0569]NLU84592.1 DUF3533 domain-containing protein [Rhodococcus sp. HNM0569]